MVLTPDQKRFLAGALHDLEDQLTSFKEKVSKDVAEGIFRRGVNPFPAILRGKILSLIGQIESDLVRARQVFSLPVEEEDLRWQMVVSLTHFANTLDACNPEGLASYGAVDRQTAREVARFIKALQQKLSELVEAVKQGTGDSKN